jgi:hypothetical protein
MAQHALGDVSPASTTVALRATNNRATPAQQFAAQAIQFQALAGNTGSIYICDREEPTLTEHVHHEILAPNGNPATRPSWSVGNPAGANPLNVADYWILPENASDGVRVTAIKT